MNSINIDSSRRSYLVHFLPLDQAASQISDDSRWITDHNVARSWSHVLAGREHLEVPPGEGSKCLDALGRIAEWLANTGASRSTTIVAFGGGVIGDLAGFAAATYMRGVPLIQIPTTLLAQVDSSVGGKVAVDIAAGKNLVGAFYPPDAVYVPVEALQTLPPREFTNGMAEVWKYAFILDLPLLQRLQDQPIDVESPDLSAVIHRCIELKQQVVSQDEFETNGLRAILNFGHTVGHAIEQVVGYGTILHGEAISIGMVVEARLGEHLGITERGVSEVVERCLQGQGLPVDHAVLRNEEALLQIMRRDKKATTGNLAFSLLTQLGGCKLVKGVERDAVLAALRTS